MQKARILIPLAMIFGCMMSYGALTNADYANETWRLVWDGASPMTLSPGEATRLQCHWESSLGRREVALVTVVSGNAGKDSYGGITAQGTGCVGISITRNVTHTSSFNSLSFYDDNVRYFNLRIGDYSRPKQAYYQIGKPTIIVNGGTTNIVISWGVEKQHDSIDAVPKIAANHMVAAEVYRSELMDDGLTQKTPYELVYGEYDEDKVRSGSYSWTDYSVKLGVSYSYCVRVYGIGIIDDTKTLMIGYDTGGDFRTSDAGVAQTKACAIIYENLRGATPKNPSYYVPGTVISFANPSPIPGGIFQGWTPKSIPATATGRQIVSANWILDKFNVSFDGNGGILNDYGIGSASSRMEYGDEIVAPEVTRIGYTFTGWSPGVAVTVPANDVTYVAQWSVNRYHKENM